VTVTPARTHAIDARDLPLPRLAYDVAVGEDILLGDVRYRVVGLSPHRLDARTHDGAAASWTWTELAEHDVTVPTPLTRDPAQDALPAGPTRHGTPDPMRDALGIGAMTAEQTARWASLTNKQRDALLAKAAHLLEAETGHRGGTPGLDGPEGPDPRYHPATTKPSLRYATKAVELGVSERTVWEWAARYFGPRDPVTGERTDRNILALAPAPRPWRASSMHPGLHEAMRIVLAEHAFSADVPDDELFRRVRALLPADASLPKSDTDWRKHLDQVEQVLGIDRHWSAKTRRSRAKAPVVSSGPRYQSPMADDALLFDSTPLDVFALDDRTGMWVQVELTLAMCLHTRRVRALRLSAVNPSAMDANLVLLDALNPVPWGPNPALERLPWPVAGLPGRIQLQGDALLGGDGIDRLWFQTAVVDRGAIWLSHAFRRLCARLSIGIDVSRPGTPTDKPQVERMFLTAVSGFLSRLSGFKGKNILERPEDAEAGAFFTLAELEQLIWYWVVTVYHRTDHSGLRDPDLPARRISPDQALADSIAAAGVLRLPIAIHNLYAEACPAVFRKVIGNRVQIAWDDYEDPTNRLLRYNRPSSWPGGKWPVHQDPRDLTRAYFRDGDEWLTLWAVGRPAGARPADRLVVAHARAQIFARGTTPNRKQMRQELWPTIEALGGAPVLSQPARRALRRFLATTASLARDDDAHPAPAALPTHARVVDHIALAGSAGPDGDDAAGAQLPVDELTGFPSRDDLTGSPQDDPALVALLAGDPDALDDIHDLDDADDDADGLDHAMQPDDVADAADAGTDPVSAPAGHGAADDADGDIAWAPAAAPDMTTAPSPFLDPNDMQEDL
jgi:hypothetical protein